jgi:hypothetical protein
MIIDVILPSLCSGIVTGIVTILTLKIDVKWLKEIIASHDERIKHLERN